MNLTPAPHTRSRSLLLWICAVLACAFALPIVLDAYAQGTEPHGGSSAPDAAAATVVVCGNVYDDVNGNRLIDGADRTVPGAMLDVLNQHEQLLVTVPSDNRGHYCAALSETGIYRVQKLNPATYVSVDAFAGAGSRRVNADQIIVLAEQAGTYDGNNFLIARSAGSTATSTTLPTAATSKPTTAPSPTALRVPAQADTATPTATASPTLSATPHPTSTHDTSTPTLTSYPHNDSPTPSNTPTNTTVPSATSPSSTRTATATIGRIVPTSGGGFEDESLATAYWLGVIGLILIGVARYLHKGSLD